MRRLQEFLLEEDGPTAVEYAVMLGFIICVCILAINSVGNTTSNNFKETVDLLNP